MKEIELTNRMIDNAEHANGGKANGDMTGVVRAVLDVVIEDYIVQRRCGNYLTPALRCTLPIRHDNEHRCSGPGGGSTVSWS